MHPLDFLGRTLAERGYPALPLPHAGADLSGKVRGRYPIHGYQRGWGIEHGGLREAILAHPLYQEAIAASRGRSVMNQERMMNIFLIIACYFDGIADHDIVECGSYRGGSALFMALLLKRLYPQARIYAHDTFTGMPDVDPLVDRHVPGDFADADFPGLQRARDEQGFDNLHLVTGLVQDTFPASYPSERRIGLLHLDMDIYEPTIYAQNAAWPMLTVGGYIVYDDATVPGCIGATQAVEELLQQRRMHSEQVHPHFVLRAKLD
jgi:predicted O-methyltransferase YrrM